jgi:hypothetical protein
MQKILSGLALLVLLAGAPTVHAQKLRIGFKVGGNLARYRGEDYYSGGATHPGLCAGLILHLPVSSFFSVQPELLFSQKGAKNQSTFLQNNAVAYGNQRLSYAEIPLLAKLRIHAGPFVEFGPTLGYLLSASLDDRYAPIGQQSSVNNRSDFKSFEWGYAAGIGYHDAKGLLLGVRYNGGLSPIFRADTYKGYSGINDELRIYNRTIQLYVGYILLGRPQFPQQSPASE